MFFTFSLIKINIALFIDICRRREKRVYFLFEENIIKYLGFVLSYLINKVDEV